MKIDSHQHYWKLSRGDYGWLEPHMEKIYRDFTPEDLQPHLEKFQIDKTIVVQAAPTMEETEYLLDLYTKYESIAGVVGWIDMDSDHFKEHFSRFRENEGFVGIRPMLHDIEDDRWILRPKVMKNLEVLIEEDFPIDILIRPRHLPHILEMFVQLPELRAVIDHIAKPLIAKGIQEPWNEQMRQIAGYEKVMCKLSGMVTEADHDNWKVEDLIPYVTHVVEIFGTDKVMYGSDWPVCLFAGSYSEVHNALTEALPQNLTKDQIAAIFGDNAKRFYKLNL